MTICRQQVEVGDLLLDDQNGIPYEVVSIDEEREVIGVEVMDEEDEWQFTKKQVEGMVRGGFTRLISNGSLWW